MPIFPSIAYKRHKSASCHQRNKPIENTAVKMGKMKRLERNESYPPHEKGHICRSLGLTPSWSQLKCPFAASCRRDVVILGTPVSCMIWLLGNKGSVLPTD